jgi:hypothetical protein
MEENITLRETAKMIDHSLLHPTMRRRIDIALLMIVLTFAGTVAKTAMADDDIPVIAAAPDKGFNYPYILRIPPETSRTTNVFLVVEPNNTGTASDDFDVHLEAAKKQSKHSIGSFVAGKLQQPLLIPVFPRSRTEWQIYTHALDRDVMMLPEGPMQRLDLQLQAMVDDARERLAQQGYTIDKKILLNGFSASGNFVNRFTLLHPERVLAVACGGINGLLMLPLHQLADVDLVYPLGLKDYENITSAPFNIDSWRNVSQFIYMGAEDDNDAVLFDDAYSESERVVIFDVIGKQILSDRWAKCQEVYEASEAKVIFNTYPGIGHATDRDICYEILSFFQSVLNDQP